MADKRQAGLRTRRQIIELLKQQGPSEAGVLANQIGVSAMAVRQHLYQLQDEQLVTYQEQPRPVGRPAKQWELTEAADRYFPDGHATLAVDLVTALRDTFGKEGLDQLVAARAQQQICQYRDQVPGRASLRKRIERLVQIRTDEGYMAELVEESDGSYLLIENHCPICSAATACTGLCAAELEVFQSTLGNGICIVRTEHILEGARRCVYRISKRPLCGGKA